eukprot:COSAG03_NODE_2673_length_2534_cov_9.324846_1_plen_54_part_10
MHPKAPLWHELVYAGKHARHQDPPLGVPRKHRNYGAEVREREREREREDRESPL